MIHFFSEELSFEPERADTIKKWLHTIALQEGCPIDELNYIFCNDEYLHRLNVEFLNHDTLTDILTFDNREENTDEITGDIFISVDRVKDNAMNLSIEFTQELHRVMVHGLLHLLGYSDHTPEEKSMMRKKEDACLSLLL